MKKFVATIAVLSLVTGVSPAQNFKTDIFPATPQAYALLVQYKEIVGEIVNATGSSITLRVKYDHAVVTSGGNTPNSRNNNNNNSMNQLNQRLRSDQARLARTTNPAQAQQISRQMQQLQMQLYRQQVQAAQHAQQQMLQQIRANTKIDHDFIDFELPLTDKVVVRRTGSSGLDFDDKGFPKEPASGEKGLVGVAAKVDELKSGAQVKVYLAPGLSSATPAKKDSSGAILSPAVPGGRPMVRMAVILEGAPMATPKKK